MGHKLASVLAVWVFLRAQKEIAVLVALVALVATALLIHAQVVIKLAPLLIYIRTSVLVPVHRDL
jgi:hypothetical protein